MARASYGTPDIQAPEPRVAASTTAERTFTWSRYGHRGATTFEPSRYRCPIVAARLFDAVVEVLKEKGYPDTGLTSSVRSFLEHLDNQPHSVGGAGAMALDDLRRRHLDAWELSLLAEHRQAGTDTRYRRAVYLFALLKRIEQDQPGSLHHEVVTRLESHTRLRHVRNDGLAPYSAAEAKKLRAAAHRAVHRHLNGTATEPDRIVLIALHVLLVLATGEPPEVVRQLSIDDIVATASPSHDEATMGMTPAQRLAWLAEHDAVDEYAVTYTKNRAHQTYQEVYRRDDRATHAALTAAVRITASLRAATGSADLWLLRRRDGGVTAPPWNSKLLSVRRLIERAGLAVSEPQVYSRLRKVVVSREARRDPRRYLSSGRRHSTHTFLGSYTNDPVMRAEAGKALTAATSQMFQAALTAPTVITPEDEARIVHGHPPHGLDQTTATALVNGDLDGPHVACRDSTSSPYAAPGTPCPRSMTGTCFGCENALITRRHLPAALLVAELCDPARAADPEVWLEHWKPIHDALTQVILPAFDPEDIVQARTRLSLTPVDHGIRNDLRGAE